MGGYGVSDPLGDNLGEYRPAPTVLLRVLDFVEAAGRPVTQGEVARGLGIRTYRAGTSLQRLTVKGLLVAWKGEVPYPNIGRAGRYKPGSTRLVRPWLYAPAKE